MAVKLVENAELKKAFLRQDVVGKRISICQDGGAGVFADEVVANVRSYDADSDKHTLHVITDEGDEHTCECVLFDNPSVHFRIQEEPFYEQNVADLAQILAKQGQSLKVLRFVHWWKSNQKLRPGRQKDTVLNMSGTFLHLAEYGGRRVVVKQICCDLDHFRHEIGLMRLLQTQTRDQPNLSRLFSRLLFCTEHDCDVGRVGFFCTEYAPFGTVAQLVAQWQNEFKTAQSTATALTTAGVVGMAPIDRTSWFSWTTRLRIATQLVNALAFMHQRVRYVHGDVKADNLLIRHVDEARGEVHVELFDFGSARSFDDPPVSDISRLRTTLTHCAPEVYEVLVLASIWDRLNTAGLARGHTPETVEFQPFWLLPEDKSSAVQAVIDSVTAENALIVRQRSGAFKSWQLHRYDFPVLLSCIQAVPATSKSKLATKQVSLEAKSLGPAEVYAFGIFLAEMASQGNHLFDYLSPTASLREFGILVARQGMRPKAFAEGMTEEYRDIMTMCWDGKPQNRFTIKQLQVHMKSVGAKVATTTALNGAAFKGGMGDVAGACAAPAATTGARATPEMQKVSALSSSGKTNAAPVSFASSNFKIAYRDCNVADLDFLDFFQCVKNVISWYGNSHNLSPSQCKSFCKTLADEAFAKDTVAAKEMIHDVARGAQRVWTSARVCGGTEFCSMLNGALRCDDMQIMRHVATITKAINVNLCDNRRGEHRCVYKQSQANLFPIAFLNFMHLLPPAGCPIVSRTYTISTISNFLTQCVCKLRQSYSAYAAHVAWWRF